jgi:transposase
VRRERDADLDRLTSHVRRFATMMPGLSGEDLEQWIIVIERGPLTPVASLARNLRRDQDAVHAGLTLPHSSGRAEGAVTINIRC